MIGSSVGDRVTMRKAGRVDWPDRFRQTVGLAMSAGAAATALATNGGTSAREQAWMLSFAFIGLLLVAWNRRAGAGGSSFLYFVIFALFHGGLVFAYAMRGQEALLGGGDNSWIVPDQLAPAVKLAILGVAAAAVGVAFAQPRTPAPSRALLVTVGVGRLPLIAGLAAAVGALIVGSVIMSNGGVGAAGYIEFLDAVAGDGMFGYGSLLLGLGLALMVAAGGRSRAAGWVGLGALALAALPLGLRGPVLFPLVTMIMIEAKRRPLRLWIFALTSVAVLAAISVLRQTRAQGISGLLAGGWTRIDPLDGAAEMGYSLYPVVQVERWMTGGSEPMYGSTFIAPITRALERVLGASSMPADQDMRLFNVEIFTRVGPIGGSPIAEGYRNFEVLGVIIVMLLLGYMMARIDQLPGTAAGAAVAAVVMLPFVTAVRNSFAPVIPQILIGLSLVVVAYAGSARVGSAGAGASPR